MTCYSHSRLGTFQQCKYKYKLQYIDKIKVDIPDTIETFMGKLVHETLEKIYKDLQFNKINSKEDLIKFYENQWDERYSDKIIVVNVEYTEENYKERGKKFIIEFYDHYKPFDQLRTIGLETEDKMPLEKGNHYHIRIDRLACDKEGNYYVCDYKTNNKLKLQDDLDEDRQLAMYSLWIKNMFNDCKSVKLVWYFLAFDKEMVSERSDEQLLQLKKEIEALIQEIEQSDSFPTHVTPLCNWCKFQQLCPAWKHKFEVEEKQKSFGLDDGLTLVDEYSKLQQIQKEAEAKIDKLKADLIAFASQHGIDVVFGTDKKCSVKSYDKIVFPKESKEKLLQLIKEKGLYDKFSSLNYFKLMPKIRNKEIDNDIINLTKNEKAYRLSLLKRRD